MEKEIESAIYFELHLAQTDEPDWEEQASKDIAQAVAEWMRKGVVWQGVETAYLTEADGDTPETMWLEPAEGGDGPIIEMYGDPQGIEDGQLYLVTVRVEGGSG